MTSGVGGFPEGKERENVPEQKQAQDVLNCTGFL